MKVYFRKEILKEAENLDNGIGSPNWQLCLCLVFAWTCISGILIKGVKTSGKASYFLAFFPYFVMMILLVRSATLEGAWDGMLYFIYPDWSKIYEAKVWYAATTQVFYSLAVCFGSIIMYSSYNKIDHKINRDVHVITILDTFTSLLAGIIIFGILGHLAWILKVPVEKVTESSVALAFMSYPELISKIDFIPNFFAMVFFIMLFVLGIGSNIGMASCIMTVIRDRFPAISCWKIILSIAFIGVSVGMIYTTPGGMFLMNFLDFYGASFVALILAIIEIITVTWIYGVDRLCLDIEFMLKFKTGLYWKICWKFITPSIMIFVFGYYVYTWKPLTYQGKEYPELLHIIGWSISAIILLQLPFWAFIAFRNQKEKSFWSKFINSFQPDDNWGPYDVDKSK
jgi:solute carrier family 6 (neurotransmitter transporter, glycine) member 5/9